MTARRRMAGDARREQLLDAAATIVDTDGFPALTIERVAATCDVTRTVVYQHFGSLDGLVDAVIERASARAGEAVVAAESSRDRPTLRTAMARVFAAVDADPMTWRMFLVAPQAGPSVLEDRLAEGRAVIRRHNFEAARGAGELADPELTLRMLQVVADELVRLRLADPAEYPVERLLDQFEATGRAILRAGRVRT